MHAVIYIRAPSDNHNARKLVKTQIPLPLLSYVTMYDLNGTSVSHPATSRRRSAQLRLTFDSTSTSPSSVDEVHHSGPPYQTPHDFSSHIISLPLIIVFPIDLRFRLNSTPLICMTRTFRNSCFTLDCDFLSPQILRYLIYTLLVP
jgi:hypothetical protein